MFKTPYNYKNSERIYETFKEDSLTEPNQAHSIDEIFNKFKAGVRLEIQKPINYDGLDNFDDIDVTKDGSFDLSDYDILKRRFEERSDEREAQRPSDEVVIQNDRKDVNPDDVNEE